MYYAVRRDGIVLVTKSLMPGDLCFGESDNFIDASVIAEEAITGLSIEKFTKWKEDFFNGKGVYIE